MRGGPTTTTTTAVAKPGLSAGGQKATGKKKKKKKTKIILGEWNVRTLLDRPDRAQRRTALVALELKRYNIDIAALSETRFSGAGSIEEMSGYTFFWQGKAEGPRQAGVAFAIRKCQLASMNV